MFDVPEAEVLAVTGSMAEAGSAMGVEALSIFSREESKFLPQWKKRVSYPA